MSSPHLTPAPRLSSATAGAFTSRSGRQGRSYFDEGRVTIEGADEDTIVAFVRGSRPRPYAVAIRFAEVSIRSRLEVSCTCPYFVDGYPCKHIHATLLAIDAAGIQMVSPSALEARLDVVPYKPDLPLDDDWFFEGEHSLRRITGMDGVDGLVRRPEWQDKVKALRRAVGNWQEKLPEEVVLESGAPRQFWYWLDAARTEELQTLVVAVEQRSDSDSGPRPLSLRRQDLHLVTRTEDREALARLIESPLEGPAGSSKDTLFAVTASAVEAVLHLLVRTEGFAVRRGDGTTTAPLTIDTGGAWRFSLALEPEVDDAFDEADDEDEADDDVEALLADAAGDQVAAELDAGARPADATVGEAGVEAAADVAAVPSSDAAGDQPAADVAAGAPSSDATAATSVAGAVGEAGVETAADVAAGAPSSAAAGDQPAADVAAGAPSAAGASGEAQTGSAAAPSTNAVAAPSAAGAAGETVADVDAAQPAADVPATVPSADAAAAPSAAGAAGEAAPSAAADGAAAAAASAAAAADDGERLEVAVERAAPVAMGSELAAGSDALEPTEDPDSAVDRELRMVGRLRRGDTSHDHSAPDVILRSGWLVLEGALARVTGVAGLSWLRYLRKAGGVTAPTSQLPDLLREVVSIPGLPTLELPDPWREQTGEPESEIVFREPRARTRFVEAQVFFHYGEGRFALGSRDSGLVEDATTRVIRRDAERERSEVARLADLGCRRAEGRDDLAVSAAQDDMPVLVRKLVRAGWRVEASGRRMRKLSGHDIRLTSGQDWFDLTGELDFDGVKAELPELLRAIKAGSQFVRLDDGSDGVLPEEWLDRYAALANLGSRKGRNLRFASSQTILLDMLLEGQDDVVPDEGFERARASLDRTAKVEPRIEDETFKGTLRDYQRLGLGWMAFLRRIGLGGCLADDMGLGKTVQVLALLLERRREGATAPTLVVAPRSLIHNWMDEAHRFTPQLKCLAFVGPERHLQLPSLTTYDLIVTTYGTLRRDVSALSEIEFDYVILDEAQSIKNASAQASKAARLLRGRHRLALSGTPIENHLVELWSIFEFLNPRMLGARREFGALARPERRGALQKVARGLAPMILRRTKDEVLSELPAKTQLTVYCELEGEERRRYDELRNHLRTSLTERVQTDGMGRSKIHVLEALLRLRQAACHPGLIDEKRRSQGSAKLDTLIDHLTEVLAEGHRALVFSQFVQLLSIVRARFEREGIQYSYLDGSTRDREAVVRSFQENEENGVFLISLRAGGLGLNLTEASYVYILDPWWNPAVEAQAIDRAHRIGQTRPVFAYRLIARGTVEEKIQALQAEKVQLAEAIVASNESLVSQMTLDDLRSLLS